MYPLTGPRTEASAPTRKFAALHTPAYRTLFRLQPVVDDGGQHRARHQLLGDVPGVSLAGARRLRRHQPLAAVPAVLAARRRARGPPRLPEADPDFAGAVHDGVAGVGRSVSARDAADVARGDHPARPRRRGGRRRPCLAAHHPRHGGEARFAERDSPERQQPLPRDSRRPGDWRRHDAVARPGVGAADQRRPLPAVHHLRGATRVYGSRAGKAPRAIGPSDLPMPGRRSCARGRNRKS